MNKPDIYQTVTNAIIEAIESGQTEEKFQMPWSGFASMPFNINSGKAYRGVNVPVLWAYQMKYAYVSGYWGTYKQWQEMGVQVRKGEKSVPVVFWNQVEVEPQKDNEEKETRLYARWFSVFNADQVDGFELPATKTINEVETLQAVDDFVRNTNARIKSRGTRAYYDRSHDLIVMPSKALFHDTETMTSTEAFYATLLHELTHWTGAKERLDRKKGKKFGDADYAYEELIAELSAAMLCVMLGITSSTRADHAQYIDIWLKALKNDKRFIFSAASHAQKAVDYLFLLQPEIEKQS